MNIKELFTEDRGVSPVIGVILMVAITVILAAVIGAFVLGLGDQASSSAPQAQFSFSYDTDREDPESSSITVSHSGGQDVDTSEISIRVAGETIYDSGGLGEWSEENQFTLTDEQDWGDVASTGDRLEIKIEEDEGDIDDALDGEEVTIVWSNPSGGSSNTLATSRWSV